MLYVAIALLILALIVLIPFILITKDTKQELLVSPKEARDMLATGHIYTVIDVRKKEQYAAGHYPDALHLPLATLMHDDTDIAELIAQSIFEPVLVYCNSGRQAKLAAEFLSDNGVPRVYYVTSPYWELLE